MSLHAKNGSNMNSKPQANILNSQTKDEQISSIKRQYDFKFIKQVQFREMVEQKLRQQVNQLQFELQKCKSLIKCLQQKLNKQQNEKLPLIPSSHPSIEVHLKKILQSLQQQHKHCIQTRRQYMDNQETLKIKINLLENENHQLNKQIKQLKRKVKSIDDLQHKFKQAEVQIQKLKYTNQSKQRQFIRQLSQLQKQIQLAKISNNQQKDYQQNNYSTNIINRQNSLTKQNCLSKQNSLTQQKNTAYTNQQIEYKKKVKPFIKENSFSQNYSLLLLQRSKHEQNQQNIRRQLQDRKTQLYQKQNLNSKQQISNKNLSDKQIINNLYKKDMSHFEGQQMRTVDYYDFVKENKVSIVDAFYSTRKKNKQTTNKHPDHSNRSTLKQIELLRNLNKSTIRQKQSTRNSNQYKQKQKQSERNSICSTLRQKHSVRQSQRRYQYL